MFPPLGSGYCRRRRRRGSRAPPGGSAPAQSLPRAGPTAPRAPTARKCAPGTWTPTPTSGHASLEYTRKLTRGRHSLHRPPARPTYNPSLLLPRKLPGGAEQKPIPRSPNLLRLHPGTGVCVGGGGGAGRGGGEETLRLPLGRGDRAGGVGGGEDLRNLLLPREREDVCREQVGWRWEAGAPVLSRGTRESSKARVARGEAVWRWESPNSGSFWAAHSTLSLRAGSLGSRWGVPGAGILCDHPFPFGRAGL